MVQVTWQKKNGEIVERYLHLWSNFAIGEYNAWGWRVVNIKHLYKGKYYSSSEYDRIIDKNIKRDKKKALWRQKMCYTYKTLYHIGFIWILFRYLEPIIKKIV